MCVPLLIMQFESRLKSNDCERNWGTYKNKACVFLLSYLFTGIYCSERQKRWSTKLPANREDEGRATVLEHWWSLKCNQTGLRAASSQREGLPLCYVPRALKKKGHIRGRDGQEVRANWRERAISCRNEAEKKIRLDEALYIRATRGIFQRLFTQLGTSSDLPRRETEKFSKQQKNKPGILAPRCQALDFVQITILTFGAGKMKSFLLAANVHIYFHRYTCMSDL